MKVTILALALTIGGADARVGQWMRRRLGYEEGVDAYSDTGYCYKHGNVGGCALDQMSCLLQDTGAPTTWYDHSSSMDCSCGTADAVEYSNALASTVTSVTAGIGGTFFTDAKHITLADASSISPKYAVTGAGVADLTAV